MEDQTDERAKLAARNELLEEMLLEKEQQLRIRDRQVEEYAFRVGNLQQYLDLFLNHPAYKIYKFFKKFWDRTDSFPRNDPRYDTFQLLFEPSEEERRQQVVESRGWDRKPQLDIVTAVFGPPLSVFQETASSVLAQTYEHWMWHVADASPENTIWEFLSQLAQKDSRIRPVRLPENKGISANTNEALRRANGDYIVMLDHDDILAPFALYAVAREIRDHPDADFLYSDADKLDESGRRCQPLFKPDWSPEMMLSFNLLNQLSVFRRKLLEEVGYLDPALEGAQDWDLYFRITERTNHVYHIPQVLYHWRRSSGSTAQALDNKSRIRETQTAVVTNHLNRIGITDPEVKFDLSHRIHATYPISMWKPASGKLVSVIIPSRDHLEVLRKCLHTLFTLTTSADFQVVLVDTGSENPATWKFYETCKHNPAFKLVQFKEAFNFSKACNFGARFADGDLFLFLNNDTEIMHSDWMTRMAQWFEFRDVGIVGAKLLYPNGRIQHGGVVLGMGGLASHLFLDQRENLTTIFGNDCWYRNLMAVTGACLMISRVAFDAVHGFDEEFKLNYSDVDLCLRVHEAGYRIVHTPQARLLHRESVTHERRIPRSDFERAGLKWEKWLRSGDPYFNANLNYRSAIPQFKKSRGDSPYRINQDLMAAMPHKEMILLPDDVRFYLERPDGVE